MGDGEKRICTLRVFAHGQKWAKVGKSGQKRAKRHVGPVFASPLPRPRSLLCALHTSTRAQSTLVTHAPCVRRTASDARALTRQHALARQKQGWRARVTGHWLTVGRLAADTSGAHTLCKHARHLRCSRGPRITHTLCMPSTSTVATVCTDLNMMSEMKNETMQKTKNKMNDASRCVPLAPALPMRTGPLACTPQESTRRALSPQTC